MGADNTPFDPIGVGSSPVAQTRTPWAVNCEVHNLVHLTNKEYNRQLARSDALWICPLCGRDASWSDDEYEAYLQTADEEGGETT